MARLLQTGTVLTIVTDGGVGSRGGNERGDVGLVQYGLKLVTSGLVNPLGGHSGGLLTVPGQQPIKVDGFNGPQTVAYIKAYQEQRRRSPGLNLGLLPEADGAFAPRGAGGWSFSVLRIDAEQVTPGGNFVNTLRGDFSAPAWLRAFFFA